MPFTTIARIVVRPTEDGRGDLILGAMFKDQTSGLLRPGLVYGIRDVMGSMTITPVGNAAIGRNAKDSRLPGLHWLGTPDQILASGNKFILTDREYDDLVLVGGK